MLKQKLKVKTLFWAEVTWSGLLVVVFINTLSFESYYSLLTLKRFQTPSKWVTFGPQIHQMWPTTRYQ